MSRRTERPYKVDGAGKLARHSAARYSAPEINGPVVQQEFTSLLRETCSAAPPATAGTEVSNGRRRTAGVSRGRSTESNEPDNTGSHRKGSSLYVASCFQVPCCLKGSKYPFPKVAGNGGGGAAEMDGEGGEMRDARRVCAAAGPGE